MCVYIYIYIYISWEHACKMLQHVTIYDNKLQNVATRADLKTKYYKMYETCGPSVKAPFVPTPSGSR